MTNLRRPSFDTSSLVLTGVTQLIACALSIGLSLVAIAVAMVVFLTSMSGERSTLMIARSVLSGGSAVMLVISLACAVLAWLTVAGIVAFVLRAMHSKRLGTRPSVAWCWSGHAVGSIGWTIVVSLSSVVPGSQLVTIPGGLALSAVVTTWLITWSVRDRAPNFAQQQPATTTPTLTASPWDALGPSAELPAPALARAIDVPDPLRPPAAVPTTERVDMPLDDAA